MTGVAGKTLASINGKKAMDILVVLIVHKADTVRSVMTCVVGKTLAPINGEKAMDILVVLIVRKATITHTRTNVINAIKPSTVRIH
eukprot:142416-Ditylum_brightwellii.AAC.1